MISLLIVALGLGTIPVSGSTPAPVGEPLGVKMVSESVIFQIEGDDVLVNATYVFKNLTAKPVTVPTEIQLSPVDEKVQFEAWSLGGFAATLDKKPLPFTRTTWNPEKSQRPTYRFTLNCVANGTHALRLTYRAGQIRLERERTFVYVNAGAAKWADKVDIANYSFKYTLKTVFAIKSLEPDYKWQWGETGAFARRTNFEPNPKEEIRLNYWPGDF